MLVWSVFFSRYFFAFMNLNDVDKYPPAHLFHSSQGHSSPRLELLLQQYNLSPSLPPPRNFSTTPKPSQRPQCPNTTPTTLFYPQATDNLGIPWNMHSNRLKKSATVRIRRRLISLLLNIARWEWWLILMAYFFLFTPLLRIYHSAEPAPLTLVLASVWRPLRQTDQHTFHYSTFIHSRSVLIPCT